MATIQDLPTELFEQILAELPWQDYDSNLGAANSGRCIEGICRRWYDVVNKGFFRRNYRHHYDLDEGLGSNTIAVRTAGVFLMYKLRTLHLRRWVGGFSMLIRLQRPSPRSGEGNEKRLSGPLLIHKSLAAIRGHEFYPIGCARCGENAIEIERYCGEHTNPDHSVPDRQLSYKRYQDDPAFLHPHDRTPVTGAELAVATTRSLDPQFRYISSIDRDHYTISMGQFVQDYEKARRMPFPGDRVVTVGDITMLAKSAIPCDWDVSKICGSCYLKILNDSIPLRP